MGGKPGEVNPSEVPFASYEFLWIRVRRSLPGPETSEGPEGTGTPYGSNTDPVVSLPESKAM